MTWYDIVFGAIFDSIIVPDVPNPDDGGWVPAVVYLREPPIYIVNAYETVEHRQKAGLCLMLVRLLPGNPIDQRRHYHKLRRRHMSVNE